MEVKRIGDILRYQNLLDAMGSEKVRSDFQTGKHGAVVLTEENLKQLDDLYKLLSPSREGESNYAEELTKASEHFASLLDGKDKPVVGTSYKDLKVLIDLIDDCGYFEHAMQEEEGHENEFVVVSTTEIPEADSAEVIIFALYSFHLYVQCLDMTVIFQVVVNLELIYMVIVEGAGIFTTGTNRTIH